MKLVIGPKSSVLLIGLGAFLCLGLMMPVILRAPPVAARPMEIAWSIFLTILVASWCQADSRSKSMVVGRGLLWLIVLFMPVGLLVYLFRSRAPVKAVLAFVMTLGFALLLLVSYVVGFIIVDSMGLIEI